MVGMSQEMIVYGLVDPRTKEVRYVGRSSSWMTRPAQHRRDARKPEGDSEKLRWIRELLALGLDYEVIVLEMCQDIQALMDAERRWILEGWSKWPLLNKKDGPSGATIVSAETREKIAATKRGKPRPDLKGKPNPGTSAALRIRHRGEAWRDKMKAVWSSNIGRPSTERGKLKSAETRARMSAARTGTQWSAAQRAAIEATFERKRLAKVQEATFATCQLVSGSQPSEVPLMAAIQPGAEPGAVSRAEQRQAEPSGARVQPSPDRERPTSPARSSVFVRRKSLI
jgi:hypothetical protein